jgi:hypothetical protein
MTHSINKLLRIALSGIIGIGCLFLNENMSPTKPESLVTTAEARVGRPATPMSYAGVARRTTRRAVGAGAAAGAYYGSSCVQVVDAYGRIVTQCP